MDLSRTLRRVTSRKDEHHGQHSYDTLTVCFCRCGAGGNEPAEGVIELKAGDTVLAFSSLSRQGKQADLLTR